MRSFENEGERCLLCLRIGFAQEGVATLKISILA